jgi:hypothetical protein
MKGRKNIEEQEKEGQIRRRNKCGDPKAYRAELAKAIEASFAYKHLLLAGYTKASILQLTGLTDLSQLRREHALELIQQKAVAEEIGKRKVAFKPFGGKPKRPKLRTRRKPKSA